MLMLLHGILILSNLIVRHTPVLVMMFEIVVNVTALKSGVVFINLNLSVDSNYLSSLKRLKNAI